MWSFHRSHLVICFFISFSGFCRIEDIFLRLICDEKQEYVSVLSLLFLFGLDLWRSLTIYLFFWSYSLTFDMLATILKIWRPLENEDVINLSLFHLRWHVLKFICDNLCSHHQHLYRSLVHSKCEGEMLDLIKKFGCLPLPLPLCCLYFMLTRSHVPFHLFSSFDLMKILFFLFSFEWITYWWWDKFRKEVIWNFTLRTQCSTTKFTYKL